MRPSTDESARIPADERIEWEMLCRYLDRTGSEGERQKVEAFFSRYPHVRTVTEAYVQAMGSSVHIDALDVQMGWTELQRRCDIPQIRDAHSSSLPNAETNTETSGVADRQKWKWRGIIASQRPHSLLFGQGRRWYFFAAFVLGAIGLVVGQASWHWLTGRQRSTQVATYATPNGQRAIITLSDGVIVSLDVGSRLEVPVDYANGHRVVRLRGRALFTVSHGGRTPFTVEAGSVTTRVLGTTFAVRHYPTDTITQVAVREGRVAVNTAIVAASHMVEVGPRGDMRMRTIDASPFAFATGVLALDKVRLADAIPELERWYNIDLRLSDPALGQRIVDGRFPQGSPADLIEVLEWMFNVRVVRDGQVLVLFPKTEQ